MPEETVKRNYKDTIFRKLFNNEEELRKLYNALEGTDYDESTPIEITTLEDVIFAGIKDDVAFKLGDIYVVLIEQQSTLCYNMPVRMLCYQGRVYEKMYDKDKFYGEKMQPLPAPRFYVLYNGKKDMPAEMTMRLSDSFMSDTVPENSCELVVKMVNIKYNEDAEVLKCCETLMGYSKLIFYMCSYLEEGYTKNLAAELTVKRCIKEGILVEFLKENASEVVNMLFDYVTIEEVADIRAREHYEEWKAEGLAEGLKEGKAEGLKEGRAEKAREIAKSLKEAKANPELISEVTGLTLSEISEL